MASVLTATVGTKGQVTLPKEVRKILGIRQAGELVGFLIDEISQGIHLKKLKVVPEGEDLTEEEYRKLLRLPKKKGGKSFSSMESLLKDLKSS